jgi:hypothetical protein
MIRWMSRSRVGSTRCKSIHYRLAGTDASDDTVSHRDIPALETMCLLNTTKLDNTVENHTSRTSREQEDLAADDFLTSEKTQLTRGQIQVSKGKLSMTSPGAPSTVYLCLGHARYPDSAAPNAAARANAMGRRRWGYTNFGYRVCGSRR